MTECVQYIEEATEGFHLFLSSVHIVNVCLSCIGVVLFFESYGCFGAVSGICGCVVRKDEQLLADACQECVLVSPGKVGTTDTCVEKCIACEKDILFGTMETYTSGCVAWRVDDCQFAVAPLYFFAVGKVTYRFGQGAIAHANAHIAEYFRGHAVVYREVCTVKHGSNAVGLPNE